MDSSKRKPIRAEVNLLRFPVFALHTEGLRTLEKIECSGETERSGEVTRWHFGAYRSINLSYPGPLSRSAHWGLLTIVSETGLPFEGPVVWSWRDLCHRIGSVPSGRTIRQLKLAIQATAGLLIRSQNAIYDKTTNVRISTHSELLHLYDSVQFQERGRNDQNAVWLADWYIASLNALYTAPIDYDVWLALDKSSGIASRMYEYLKFFCFGQSMPAIKYGTLAEYLPFRPYRYLSDAHRQLDEPLNLLLRTGVLSDVSWKQHPELALLTFTPGPLLERIARKSGGVEQHGAIDTAKTSDTGDGQSAAFKVVSEVNQLLDRVQAPTPDEIAKAGLLLQTYKDKTYMLIPIAVRLAKEQFRQTPVRRFGAVYDFFPDAERVCEKERRRYESKVKEAETLAENRAREVELKKRLDKLDEMWNSRLCARWKVQIEEDVRARYPLIGNCRQLIHEQCLAEMERTVIACKRGLIRVVCLRFSVLPALEPELSDEFEQMVLKMGVVTCPSGN